jgi:hypothetical protein
VFGLFECWRRGIGHAVAVRCTGLFKRPIQEDEGRAEVAMIDLMPVILTFFLLLTGGRL